MYLESASLPAACRRTAYRPVHANARAPAPCAPAPLHRLHLAIFHFHRGPLSLIQAVAAGVFRNVEKFSSLSPLTSSGLGRS